MAIPDEDLHPVATGRAMDIVKEHENAKADHTLYSGWFCVSHSPETHLASTEKGFDVSGTDQMTAVRTASLDHA